jgi:hypothetical protein
LRMLHQHAVGVLGQFIMPQQLKTAIHQTLGCERGALSTQSVDDGVNAWKRDVP